MLFNNQLWREGLGVRGVGLTDLLVSVEDAGLRVTSGATPWQTEALSKFLHECLCIHVSYIGTDCIKC
jgi:hypothetical protein